MGYGLQIPAHQLGGPKMAWDFRGYELSEAWVKRVSTVFRYEGGIAWAFENVDPEAWGLKSVGRRVGPSRFVVTKSGPVLIVVGIKKEKEKNSQKGKKKREKKGFH